MRRLVSVALTVALAVGITLVATVMFGRNFPAAPEPAGLGVTGLDRASGPALRQGIERLQEHLRAQPRDAAAWSALGLAHIEQARLTADPAAYPKAEAVLARSLRVQPTGNEGALAGQAALAAARHDFAAALRLAGTALDVNPYSTRAHAVRVDALVELGRYREAEDAVRRADARKPGIPIFTRYAYVMELRGRTGTARTVLERAAGSAADPADIAYLAGQLGDLAWNRGDLRGAERQYAVALRADPAYLPALDGRARVLAARGDVGAAIEDRLTLVGRAPLPPYVVALGELHEQEGRHEEARAQYAVADAWNTLARGNGVATDLEMALIAADHGDRAEALRAARAEWRRRCGTAPCSVHVEDALAWALHVNGQDREALGHARQAARTGYRNALFLFHRGMIENSLGLRAEARRSLRAALRLNPHFSASHARTAREVLG